MKISLRYFAALLMFVFLGCSTISRVGLSPTPDFTPTPERIQLTNGELEACLLISEPEVEAISGIHVTGEQGYESTLFHGLISCRYVLENGDVLLATSASTDATLVRQGNYYSASEWFQQMKMADIRMAEKAPTMFQLQDIDNLGEQAYVRTGGLIVINVLQNNIVYWFSTSTIESGGIGYDKLFKLVVIALQRAP